MSELDDCLRQILWQPLDYLEPGRLQLSGAFADEPTRQVLNHILLEGLQLPMSLSRPDTFVAVWIRHWRQLPQVARLMGAQRLWPALARGARMGALSVQVREFARCAIGPRSPLALSAEYPVLQQVDGMGLAYLLGLALPAALRERLVLQFPATVVAWQACLPVSQSDPALFFLAVQHARHSS
ncbi:protein OrgA [Pseudomonas vanderleydeniana]|uniref:Protein OrgA n=1 Tax=Pseudomonas vanderleydeniana TaxID=2745495 RepID=A0A9E6PIG6_9PSED|nr:protein OrgA [Pseudomonas vanderleydeniana]QXI27094.1 protein OrgA [Pseudomonas vanderleydeniana]